MLKGYTRGRPLTCGELRAAPIGTVVWLTYEEGGRLRINEPLTIQAGPDENGDYDMGDEKGFLCSFSLRGALSTSDTAPAEEHDQGVCLLFVADPKQRRTPT